MRPFRGGSIFNELLELLLRNAKEPAKASRLNSGVGMGLLPTINLRNHLSTYSSTSLSSLGKFSSVDANSNANAVRIKRRRSAVIMSSRHYCWSTNRIFVKSLKSNVGGTHRPITAFSSLSIIAASGGDGGADDDADAVATSSPPPP